MLYNNEIQIDGIGHGYNDSVLFTDDDEDYSSIEYLNKMQPKTSMLSCIKSYLDPNHSLFTNGLSGNKGNCNDFANEVDVNQKDGERQKICFRKIKFNENTNTFLIQIFWFHIRMILIFVRFLKDIVLWIHILFIWAADLSYVTLKNVLLYLQCYTESSCIHYIPLNLIPAIFKSFQYFIEKVFLCKIKTGVAKFQTRNLNFNNNTRFDDVVNTYNSEVEECSHKKTLIYAGIGLGIIVFLILCYSHPKLQVFKVCSTINNIKQNIMRHSNDIYMLPGKECMRADRCCKGYLEGSFRWMTCFMTIPIRIVLTAWPKPLVPEKSTVDGLTGIRNYVDKIESGFNQIKDDIDNQENQIHQIKSDFISLEQRVLKKANSFNILKPKLIKSTKTMNEVKTEIDKALNQMKLIGNFKNDVDRMVESVHIEAEDYTKFLKAHFNHIQSSIAADQKRTDAQIRNLENFLKEDQTKNVGKIERFIQRIKNDIDSIKSIQLELKSRIIPSLQLHVKYKELSEILFKDFRNKINEDIAYHIQMNKRIEKTCHLSYDKLEMELSKAKHSLTNFINKTIVNDAHELYSKLKNDLSNELHEKIVEMTNKVIEQNPPKFEKSQKKINNIKKCSLYSHIFNVGQMPSTCLKDEIVVNTSSLCNKNMKSLFPEENRITDTVDDIIDKALNLLAADVIGMTDFALESSGGSIVLERSTSTYVGRAAFLSLFKFTFGKVIKSIKKVIQPGNLPGECWAFEGKTGHVVIQLAKQVIITAVTIDHSSRFLTPDGEIKSAPKTFNVYVLKNSHDSEGIKLGEFEYSENGDPIQTFSVNEKSPIAQFVKFNFLTNHGNEEYTCIYRIRVHGIIPESNN